MKIIFTVILLVNITATISYSFPTTNQGTWRWRNDDGNESSATFIADEKTGFTLSDTTNIRLRLELYVWNETVSANNLVGIYYSTSSDAFAGTWTQITNDNSNSFVLSPSANFTDGDAATSDLLSQENPGHDEVPGLMIQSSTSFLLGLDLNQSKEFEICFRGTGNITANTQYYFSTRNVSDGSYLNGYTILPTLLTDSNLPVELTSFAAKASATSVRLDWGTATEINNYGFEIERNASPSPIEENSEAPHGRIWEAIAFVKGSGNSNSDKAYSFVDENPVEGKSYYRLKQIDNDGTFKYLPDGAGIEVLFVKPLEFALEQNYPNPFNPSTTIIYKIANSSFVSLKVFDMLGNEITTLVSEEKAPGRYKIVWNAAELASAVYYYTLNTGEFTSTKKLLLVK